jgi:GT2 family glycosyltransferase
MSQDLHEAPSAVSSRPSAAPRREIDRQHVTVVVLTYNRKQSLRRTLDALLACDVEGLRVDLRVIDDGSTDGADGMIEALRREYRGPMELHYHRQPNAGHSAAVNLGIRVTETDLLLMLDDDMVPQPGWVRAMAEAPWDETIGAVGGSIVSPEEGTWVARFCRHKRYNEFPPNDKPISFVNSGNAAYQRRALEEVGGFETLLCLGGEDIEASWRMVLAGYRLVHQPQAVTLHYHRETVRALLRTFQMRGYAQSLRNILWGFAPRPTFGVVLRKGWRWARTCLGIVMAPFKAVQNVRRGVPARDALPFAFLEWLRKTALRGGDAALQWRVFTGKQALERSSRVPEGAGDPSLRPLWARLGAEAEE